MIIKWVSARDGDVEHATWSSRPGPVKKIHHTIPYMEFALIFFFFSFFIWFLNNNKHIFFLYS